MNKLLLTLLLITTFFIEGYCQSPELWGTALTGGNGLGTIMKINGDGTGFTRVFSFLTGISPYSNLVAVNSTFYGTTAAGGTYFNGDIYSFNLVTHAYTSIFSFDSSTGYYPRGSLYVADDGKFYGTTSNGGNYHVGTLFSFDPMTNTFSKLHDFDTLTGKYPQGNVIEATNGKLYGMVPAGGTMGFGLIYSFDIHSGTFTDVYNFNFSTGASPFGSLINGPGQKLYGMAFGGGTAGYGVIFSFDPSNNTYAVLHNFDKTNGSAPFANLTFANDGMMYGMTQQGGSNGTGVLFRFDPSTNALVKLHDFIQATGILPNGSVIMASDGNLYGMATMGGANSFGTIFSFNLSNNTYTDMHDCNITEGAFPQADLIEYNSTTGIEEVNASDIASVYPNPSHESVAIHFKNPLEGKWRLVMSNMIGQTIIEKDVTQQDFLLQYHLSPGNYLLTFYGQSKRASQLLTVE